MDIPTDRIHNKDILHRPEFPGADDADLDRLAGGLELSEFGGQIGHFGLGKE